MLRIFPFGPEEYSRPYCETLDILKADCSDISALDQDLLGKTNYFIVALDSDEKNLHMAEQLRLFAVRQALESGDSCRCVIAPAVANDSHADVIRNLTPDAFEPYMTPFATLKSRYGCKQAFLTNFIEPATSTHDLYSKKHQKKDQDDIYNTISSIARCAHAPYKLYGLGWILSADISADAANRYRIKKEPFTPEQREIFAWVEHRRWNAFMRAQGFVRPTKLQLDNIFSVRKKAKSIPDKMHACLVECQRKPVALPTTEDFDRECYDYLDYVSMYSYMMEANAENEKMTAQGLQEKDYKIWDYPEKDKGVINLLS
jgi:hypothetical protein